MHYIGAITIYDKVDAILDLLNERFHEKLKAIPADNSMLQIVYGSGSEFVDCWWTNEYDLRKHYFLNGLLKGLRYAG